MTRRSDQTHQADFNDTLFLAMELSRATWLVATFATRLVAPRLVAPRLVAPRLGNTTRAATSTRFAAATILNPIADSGSLSIKNSSAWAELFAGDNCEPRSKNAPNNRRNASWEWRR